MPKETGRKARAARWWRFDKENEAFAKRVGKDRSKRTYQKYLTVRKYVAEFIKRHYKRTDMAMNELTEDFIVTTACTC